MWSTVKATRVFKGAYRTGRAITSSRRKSPVYYANALYAEKLYHYIVDNGYDTVVMPHLFPAEALTYMLRRHERRPDIRTYFVGTDYTCIPFTEEMEVDYYFIAHEELLEEYVQKGIPREKLISTGIPVSDRFRPPAPYQKDEDYLSVAGAELAVYGLCPLDSPADLCWYTAALRHCGT
ncbi:MAG: hypothetical protein K2H45_05020 [Acetatifactor sp.]|nr:hypothetical protein [Acetatifactor sp.]